MEELTLITPTFLFSAVSLLLLAYTNRFLSYAQVIRNLKDQYMKNPTHMTADQIKNLRKRLYLTRRMQVQGISSLFLCVVTMFLIYIHLNQLAVYVFAVALILLILSLATSVWEIYISVKALDIYLSDMSSKQDKEHD
jgi:hypothetical protein